MIIKSEMNLSFLVDYNKNEDLFKDSPKHVPFHFHKDYELMYVINGSGTRIVGSSIENFGNNDLVFIGPNLPHGWQGESNAGDTSRISEYIYMCFNEDLFGTIFFSLPDMQDIKRMLEKSVLGLKFSGHTIMEANSILHRMLNEKKAKRFILLLQLLELFSQSDDVKILNTRAFDINPAEKEADRINKVMKYILDNYQQDITVEKISDHIGMSPNAFSRYFKSKTYKHFIEFVNEVRITNATRLLTDNSLSIADIAYNCGYNSLSNFNRHFKQQTKFTPLEYKQKLINAH